MWYISFHGGSSGVNNIQVYHDSGKPHSNPDLLPVGGTNPTLMELRAFLIVGNLLYVVNGYKKYSQVLTYSLIGKEDYQFQSVYASKDKIEAIFHPYDLTFDAKGNGYISSQDSNVVTKVSAPQQAASIAPFLQQNYPPIDGLMPGTWVASATGKLPNNPTVQDVPKPQGLTVNYTDKTKKRIAHSVRGVLYYKDYLFVSDEPANTVKIYEIQSGELYGQIKGENLVAPVQLLVHNEVLYIGSSGNDSVVMYNLSTTIPSGTVAPTTFIDGEVKHISGMAFDDTGCFYAAERKAQKIKKFVPGGSKKGRLLLRIYPIIQNLFFLCLKHKRVYSIVRIFLFKRIYSSI